MPGMMDYFPDKYPKGKVCEKAYMYNVWNTRYPEDVKAVIEHANQQRYALTSAKVREDTILITDEWQRELDSLPFVSKQKGRMSHLLKQKSKIGVVHKERAKYPAFDFGKRLRKESNIPKTN